MDIDSETEKNPNEQCLYLFLRNTSQSDITAESILVDLGASCNLLRSVVIECQFYRGWAWGCKPAKA